MSAICPLLSVSVPHPRSSSNSSHLEPPGASHLSPQLGLCLYILKCQRAEHRAQCRGKPQNRHVVATIKALSLGPILGPPINPAMSTCSWPLAFSRGTPTTLSREIQACSCHLFFLDFWGPRGECDSGQLCARGPLSQAGCWNYDTLAMSAPS